VQLTVIDFKVIVLALKSIGHSFEQGISKLFSRGHHEAPEINFATNAQPMLPPN
jgi:hypothetical protein